MKSLSLITLLLACQGVSPAKPAKELDPKDGKSVLEHAAYNTRTQKSYETKFKARLTTSGAPLDYNGRCVLVYPSILYVHYTASGGDEKMIVRADNDVWVYNPLVGWVDSDQAAMPGAGRGIQNPDEILALLAANAGFAKLRKPGEIELALTGDDIEKIMKGQANKNAFNWKNSKADLGLTVDSQNRLQTFTCDATLDAIGAGANGGNATVKYTGEVTLVGYDGAREIKFLDEKKREIPLLPEMKSKIESVLKEKR
jgi:outer membrane lipoprotein-sorting protein